MTEIRLDNLSKRYGDTEVLRGINLTITRGEFFTLVGPSGCGKSTLLHLLAGLEELSEGEIYFDGRSVSHLPAKDRDIAVVFQSYALYPHMTVYNNIAFPLRMKKKPPAEIDRQVRKVADLLDLAALLSRKPGTLSGGQRQRVAIARAILADPRILILDEATSSLDSESESFIQDGLRALRRGRTTFVIAHRLSTIQSADQILVLEHGQIVERGTHAELLEKGGHYAELAQRMTGPSADSERS